MPGGPINGVPWSAMAGLLPGGAAIASAARRDADPNDPVNYTGVIIPTVLQIASDVLSYWTDMTCLYDRYWVPDPDKVTLPVCMFHITDITPVYSVETSKKRVILYEPQGDETLSAKELADQLRENVIRSVIDNSVKQPTTYSMEIVVPFQPIGRYVTEGVKTVSDMISSFSDLLGGTEFTDVWEGVLSSVFAFLKTAGTAAEFAGKLPGMNGVSYINMNSLEAMAESCRTLCLKMWTGYDYKYVQITNMTFKKKGTEDDVFRATLTLQEKPVLAVSRPGNMTAHAIKRNWAVTAISAVQGALVSPLISLTGVRDAAGSSETNVGMIKKMLGG
jgi:hypothetical protein